MIISAALRDRVETAAQFRCEYCRLQATLSFRPHEVDHIIATSHGGPTAFENLALSCYRCNRNKGPNIASLDYQGRLAPLFHPRTQTWSDHFRFELAIAVPLTSIGEATARILKLNAPERVIERA